MVDEDEDEDDDMGAVLMMSECFAASAEVAGDDEADDAAEEETRATSATEVGDGKHLVVRTVEEGGVGSGDGNGAVTWAMTGTGTLTEPGPGPGGMSVCRSKSNAQAGGAECGGCGMGTCGEAWQKGGWTQQTRKTRFLSSSKGAGLDFLFLLGIWVQFVFQLLCFCFRRRVGTMKEGRLSERWDGMGWGEGGRE